MRSIVRGATVVGAARASLLTTVMTLVVTWPARGKVAGVALMSAISAIVSVIVAPGMNTGDVCMVARATAGK